MGVLKMPQKVPTQVRRDILMRWLPMVLESTEGEKKFDNLMTHQACVDGRKLNSNFTTCGALPGWVMKKIGLTGEITGYGLKGVKDAAIKLNCWVDHTSFQSTLYQATYGTDRRPLPGDVYILGSQRNAGEILHIGVITNSEGTMWQTADSGQGAKELQKALYVDRKYDVADHLLDGEDVFANQAQAAGLSAAQLKKYGIRPPRRLIGWVDIDRALEVQGG
jgi:hypothetical protein